MKLSSIFGAVYLIGATYMSEAQELGIIGEVEEGGFRVVFKFVDEFPSPEIRSTFSAVEHAIEESLEDKGFSRHAYSRTGNGLKELVYYISDREDFMAAFNQALQSHPRYPIEINFYEDPEWEDFQKILKLFNREG